ncbi:MAG: hypothetical protein NTW21_21325 [Verrucomicrobia bacterium]|nr:hypothetical protein [Verrucomicrobiota bacterium]
MVSISPTQMGNLTTIEAVVPAVKGNIEVALKREAASFGLKLVSPKDTKAVVGIPQDNGWCIVKVAVNGKTVWQNGKPDQAARGLVCKGQDERYCRFEVGPGTWEFSARYECTARLT